MLRAGICGSSLRANSTSVLNKFATFSILFPIHNSIIISFKATIKPVANDLNFALKTILSFVIAKYTLKVSFPFDSKSATTSLQPKLSASSFVISPKFFGLLTLSSIFFE